MATRKRLTLDAWIREAMTDEKDGRKCSMLALVHVIGAQQKEIHSVKFGSGNSYQPEDLANTFRGRAEGFSQDLSGTQTFQLLAFYGKSEPESFQPFTVAPAADPNNPLPSEGPTPEGRMAQMMRQGEMIFQQAYRKQEHLDNASLRHIELLSQANVKLMSENMAAFNIMKEMLMEKALDTHKHRMEELTYHRASEERKKWMSMIPLLANTVMGREIFPQSAADTVLIEQIVENIDETAVMALSQFVKPELMGPLMQRFTEIQRKKTVEKENAVKALSVASGTNPELDAGGTG